MDLTVMFTASVDGVGLHGTRCSNCATWAFPARRVCAACRGRNQEAVTLLGAGQVRRAVALPRPPAGFDVPVTVGMVDLREGPAIFALLQDGLTTGDAVQAEPAQVRAGAPGFAFRAAG